MMAPSNGPMAGTYRFRHRRLRAPDMGDLLEYFEARSRSLDEEGQPYLDPPTLQFISLIKFNGVPILPPVLSRARREEMQLYKREAVRKDSRARTRNRVELHAKVQSIVAGVENTFSLKSRDELPRTNGIYKLLERRAAKHAEKSSSSPSAKTSSSRTVPTSEIITRISTSSSKSVFSDTSKTVPAEIVINVSTAQTTTQSPVSVRSAQSSSSSPKPAAKSSPASAVRKSSTSASASPGTPTKSSKSGHTNYKSLGKLGTLSKQKSHSTQHMDRVGFSKGDSYQSLSPGKDSSSLSPKSRALLPHPPHGRPPSRGSPMRQSASTPDLRTIDFSVPKEDLTKPLAKTPPKVFGGRPQKAADDEEDKADTTKLKSKLSMKAEELKAKLNKGKDEKGNSGVSKDISRKEPEKASSDAARKNIKEEKKLKEERDKPTVKPKPANLVLQNPLEALEQEFIREEETERKAKYGGDKYGGHRMEVRRELDPIQAAAAELFPFPISEEQALATLDSLQSDFQSLDQADSLPKDYNGIPLTSLKEQQIIHMLTKLSTALNIEDTLTSTGGSHVSGDPNRDMRQDQWRYQPPSQMSRPSADPRSVQYGAKSGISMAEPVDASEDSINLTHDSSTTGASSANSSHSRARMSPTGSSILSTGSSVTGSKQRMSPKSLKNTVHFSSMVTEISTSASQSYEDKISYRKLDITPKSSENFEDDGQEQHSLERDIRTVTSSVGRTSSTQSSAQSSTSLLNKVHLSPSVDSSAGSPGEMRGSDFPFEQSFPDGELNTSDKENEYVAQDSESSDENYPQMSGRSGRGQHVLNVYMANIPQGPIGENHPAVMKTSIKSDSSETSTLKASQDKLSLQENLAMYNQDIQYYYGLPGTDVDRLRQTPGTTNSSTTSLQEEITRSYILSEQNPKNKQVFDQFLVQNPEKTVLKKQVDLDDSHIHLQPIIYHNTKESLQHNRSMLDEEDQIRTNLQRVEFHDSDSEFESNASDGGAYVHAESENESKVKGQFVEENVKDGDADTEVKLSSIETDQIQINDTDKTSDSEIESEVGENTNLEHEGEQHGDTVEDTDEKSVIGDESDDNNEENESEEENGDKKDENVVADIRNEFVDDQKIDVTDELEPQLVVTEHIDEDQEEEQELKVVELQEPEVVELQEPEVVELQEPEVVELQGNNQVEETKGKAEHIQKYLTQVHEHSMHQEDFPDEQDDDADTVQKDLKSSNAVDIETMIQSFSSTIKTMNHLSQDELFRIQEEQFELLQQKLIEQQRQQLEELFVVQRRQQLKMQQELEFLQQKAKSREFQTVPGQDYQQSFSAQPEYQSMSISSHNQSLYPVRQPDIGSINRNNSHYPAIQSETVDQRRNQPSYQANQSDIASQRRNPPTYPINQSNNSGSERDGPCQLDNSFMTESQMGVETMQLPATLRPHVSNQLPQVTQAWQTQPPIMTADIPNVSQAAARSPPFPVQPVASTGYYSNPLTSSYNSNFMAPSYPNPSGVYLDPRMYPGLQGYSGVQVVPFMGSGLELGDPNLSYISHNTSYSTLPMDPGMVPTSLMGPPPPPSHQIKTGKPSTQPTTQRNNAYAYPQSPSLYQGRKDQDNMSEVSGFAQATPKQLVFSNQSTPVMQRTQPVFKPIMHSPRKKASNHYNQPGAITCPDKVFDPSMQPKFARVSAGVKGYLTRRLLRTQKVKDIIKTIDDTRNFAFSFQAETPIKKGSFSREDRTLLERIVAQLQAALLDIHEIFFEISIPERMSIISKSRHLEEERRNKDTTTRRSSGVSRSQSRLSQATLKALERKRQAQLAESAVFGSTEFRPKSAPPTTSSPQSTTDLRALRPIQGQISPIHHDGQVTVREMKERPKSAGDKIRTGTSQKPKKSGSKSSKSTNVTISKQPVGNHGNTRPSSGTSGVQQQQGTSKPSNTAGKGSGAPGVTAKQKGVTQGQQTARSRKTTEKAWR